MTNPHYEVLQQMGDDALVLSQRLCEWSGKAPTIELDISLSNLALDLVGQATLLLEYAAEVEGEGRTADALAFHRDAPEFRNCLLVEQPNGDFARTILRHFLFSVNALSLFEGLSRSSDDHLAAIAAKSVKELRYHVEYSSEWVIRLGDGSDESQERLGKALEWLWRFVDEIFIENAAWTSLVAKGVVPSRQSLRVDYDAEVSRVFDQAKLAMPGKVWPVSGGRDGSHSEHLSRLLTEMQVLPRAYPDAKW